MLTLEELELEEETEDMLLLELEKEKLDEELEELLLLLLLELDELELEELEDELDELELKEELLEDEEELLLLDEDELLLLDEDELLELRLEEDEDSITIQASNIANGVSEPNFRCWSPASVEVISTLIYLPTLKVERIISTQVLVSCQVVMLVFTAVPQVKPSVLT
jgi:hypothetical protein